MLFEGQRRGNVLYPALLFSLLSFSWDHEEGITQLSLGLCLRFKSGDMGNVILGLKYNAKELFPLLSQHHHPIHCLLLPLGPILEAAGLGYLSKISFWKVVGWEKGFRPWWEVKGWEVVSFLPLQTLPSAGQEPHPVHCVTALCYMCACIFNPFKEISWRTFSHKGCHFAFSSGVPTSVCLLMLDIFTIRLGPS